MLPKIVSELKGLVEEYCLKNLCKQQFRAALEVWIKMVYKNAQRKFNVRVSFNVLNVSFIYSFALFISISLSHYLT